MTHPSHPHDSGRCAPGGFFRLSGYDMFDYHDYRAGDFQTLEEAIEAMKLRIAKPNGTPTWFSDSFFIYSDQNECLYRGSYDKGIVQCR